MARVRARNLAVAAVVATAVTALGGASAGATIFERGRYVDEPYSFTNDSCAFDLVVEGTSSGHFRIRDGKGKTETAFFAHDNYEFTETQTNPANGKFVTITGDVNFTETKATRVEGTVFEFFANEAGRFRLYDSDGRLLARDRGSVQFHILFDTLGDDMPGGEFLEEFPPEVHGPHIDDFCEIVEPLLGS